jgi:hypothetical protein
MPSPCGCAVPGKWSARPCWGSLGSFPTAANTYLPWSCAGASRSGRGKVASTISPPGASGPPVLCMIDGHAGLRRAVELVGPRAAVQRCCVHKLRNLERKAPKHALAEIRDDFHRIVYAASADAARAAFIAFERTWAKRCPGAVTSLRGWRGTPHILSLPQVAVEDAADHKRDRAVPRRIPSARENARLAADRGRRTGFTLQPRRQRADQVA